MILFGSDEGPLLKRVGGLIERDLLAEPELRYLIGEYLTVDQQMLAICEAITRANLLNDWLRYADVWLKAWSSVQGSGWRPSGDEDDEFKLKFYDLERDAELWKLAGRGNGAAEKVKDLYDRGMDWGLVEAITRAFLESHQPVSTMMLEYIDSLGLSEDFLSATGLDRLGDWERP